jgi:hypothetical protein
MPSIHLFAFHIMSFRDSLYMSPHIYAEYFGFPTRDFPAPFNIEVAQPCHVVHANLPLTLMVENATRTY